MCQTSLDILWLLSGKNVKLLSGMIELQMCTILTQILDGNKDTILIVLSVRCQWYGGWCSTLISTYLSALEYWSICLTTVYIVSSNSSLHFFSVLYLTIKYIALLPQLQPCWIWNICVDMYQIDSKIQVAFGHLLLNRSIKLHYLRTVKVHYVHCGILPFTTLLNLVQMIAFSITAMSLA